MKLKTKSMFLVRSAVWVGSMTAFSGFAADVNKANNSTTLNNTGSWTAGVVPTAADVALWDSSVTGATSMGLGGDLSWKGIRIAGPGGAVTITAGNTLTLGTSGIDMSSATQNLSIASGLALGAGNQTWNVATGRTFTLTGSLTRSAGATLLIDKTTNTGTVTASPTLSNGIIGPWAIVKSSGTAANNSANGYTFATVTLGNIVAYTGATAVTTSYPANNAAVNYDWSAAGTQSQIGSSRAANTIRYTGTGVTQLTNSSQTETFNALMNAGTGTVTLGGGTFAMNLQSASGELVLAAMTAGITINGPIINNGATPGAVTILGAGSQIVTLAGANTFTGGVNLNSGTLLVGNTTALGTIAGSLKLNGGSFGASAGGLTIANALVTAAGSTTTIGQNANNGMTLSGALTGSGTLANFNSGTANTGNDLRFTGNLSGFTGTMQYTGSSTNSSSFWRVGATGGATVNMSGGTLNLLAGDGGTAKLFGFIDLTTAANTLRLSQLTGNGRFQGSFNGTTGVFNTIEVGNGDASSTFSGVLGLAGSNMHQIALTKVGAGTLTLTGANIHTGATTISAGTLQVGDGTTDGSIANSSGIANSGTLAYNLVGTHTFANAITGTGNLTKTGAGSLTLSGANNYSGSTSLNGGTLKVRGAMGAVSVDDATGNTFGNATSATLNMGSLTLAGDATLALSLNAAPALAVSGVLTTTPANGTVIITAGNTAWGIGLNSLISYGSFGGSLSDFSLGTLTGFSARQSSNGLVDTGTAIALDVSGDLPVWSGANGSTWTTATTGDHTGPNNWATKIGLTGTNFWATDSAEFNDTYNVGAGDVAVTNRTIDIQGANVSPNSVTFNNSSGDYTINSSTGHGIASGSVIKNGTSMVTINTSNSYTGGTTINAGTIAINSATSLGNASGALTLNNGTLETTADITTTRNITLGNANSTILTDSATTYTVNGLISGTGALNKTGAGTLTLGTSTNTFSGGLIITAGTVSVDSNLRLGGAAGTAGAITINGGTLRTTNTAALTNTHAITVGANGGVLDILGTATSAQNSRIITGAGTLFGSGTLTINGDGALDAAGGSGAVVITGANNGGYNGSITLQNGAILANEATANGLDSAATVALANNSEFSTVNTTNNNITINGGTNSNLSFTTGNTGVFAGTVTLNANGTVALRNWYDTVTHSGTISGVVSGVGGLTVTSGATAGGVLTLSSANNYSGGTTITQSVVALGDDAALGTNAFTTSGSSGIRSSSATARTIGNAFTSMSGSGVVLTFGSAGTGNLSFTDTGTTSLGSSANRGFQVDNAQTSFAGNFSGSGSRIDKTGAGILVLGGTNSSFTGGVNINAGTVSVSNVGNSAANSALGTSGTINIGATTVAGTLAYTGAGENSDKVINLAGTTGGATLDQSGTGLLKITSNLTATGSGIKTLTLQGSTAGTGEIAGNIVNSSGATSVAKTGSGAWTLSGANTYTGATTVSAGTLVLSGSSTTSGVSINAGTNTTVTITSASAAGGGELKFATGATTPVLNLHIDGGGTINMANAITSNSAVSSTIDVNNNGSGSNGVVTLTGNVAGIGNSTFNITGGNGYSLRLNNLVQSAGSSGTTTFNPTTANVSIGSLNSTTVQTKNYALDGTSSGNAITGVIGGVGTLSVTKSNTSTWTLSGASTYTGATTVSAGTLLVNGSLGNTAVTVSGGTFGGTGSIAGSVTVAAATYAPGASPGSMEIAGNLTLGIGTTTEIELGGTNFSLNGIEEYDRTKLTGSTPTLTLAGALAVSLFNGFALGDSEAFGIFQLASGATVNGTFTGLGEDALVGTFGGKDLFITYEGNVGDTGTVDTFGGNDIVLYSIPEPHAAALGALGMLMLLRRRQR